MNSTQDSLLNEAFSGLLDENLIPDNVQSDVGVSEINIKKNIPNVKIKQDGGATGCGGKVWPAGELLCKYISEKEIGVGRNVLELGSGTGLVGLALGLLIKHNKSINDEEKNNNKIYISDQKCMIKLMQDNIEINNLNDIVKAVELDWGSKLSDEFMTSPPDIILAADCVYFEPAFPLLEATLVDLVKVYQKKHKNGSYPLILMSYKKRRRADIRFFKQVKKVFLVQELNDYNEYSDYKRESVYLYKFIPKWI